MSFVVLHCSALALNWLQNKYFFQFLVTAPKASRNAGRMEPGRQHGMQNRPGGAKKLCAHTRRSPFLAVLEPYFFPNRFRIEFCRLFVGLWSIWGRYLAIWLDLLMGCCCFGHFFKTDSCKYHFCIFFWQTRFRQTSAKICQDQPNDRQV